MEEQMSTAENKGGGSRAGANKGGREQREGMRRRRGMMDAKGKCSGMGKQIHFRRASAVQRRRGARLCALCVPLLESVPFVRPFSLHTRRRPRDEGCKQKSREIFGVSPDLAQAGSVLSCLSGKTICSQVLHASKSRGPALINQAASPLVPAFCCCSCSFATNTTLNQTGNDSMPEPTTTGFQLMADASPAPIESLEDFLAHAKTDVLPEMIPDATQKV